MKVILFEDIKVKTTWTTYEALKAAIDAVITYCPEYVHGEPKSKVVKRATKALDALGLPQEEYMKSYNEVKKGANHVSQIRSGHQSD
tara:strand:- start:4114 stop:4374 length:261 start_codon:yes stop_codon:yes gene_type:complete